MIRFSDREISGERLVLDSKSEVHALGYNLMLRNCTIVLRVPSRALIISKVCFIDCFIEVKQELENLWPR